MQIPPQYSLTAFHIGTLSKIEANRLLLSGLPSSSHVKEKIQRMSILKSSLYSARIEGNPLRLEDVEISYDTKHKKEIFNILDAIKFLEKNSADSQKIDESLIWQLHERVMDGLTSELGRWRSEMGAIFNQAGVAVYVSPSPNQLPKLITQLLRYANGAVEPFPMVTALIAHLIFEKIHPFLDGNGRVGRLLIQAILKNKNVQFPLTIVLEEYLDGHKDGYYHALEIGLRDTSAYLSYMLEAVLVQSEKLKNELLNQTQQKDQWLLPPRQEEIVNVIRDHGDVTFDFIRRRFLRVPARTLRYDMKKLAEKGIIVKIGSTRGSFYRLKQKVST
jgi:Fic family protein